jgi:hypothetical protein
VGGACEKCGAAGERWDKRRETGVRSWEMMWPAGLLVGVVVLAILDAMVRAVSIKKDAKSALWGRREPEDSKGRGRM